MLRLPDGRLLVPGNEWPAALAEPASSPQGAEPEIPSVSVVIPYFDAQPQLDLVLAALQRQTHPASRVQVIVADDGSSAPPRVPAGVQVVQQPDTGFRAAAARNLGARAAEGTVLCFLDGDTIPEPGYLTELIDLPTRVADAVTVGRRRHGDFTGWTPDDLLRWFDGGAGPAELTEPAWLSEGYRASGDLHRLDDRSYRYAISAVLALPTDLFATVGGFDRTFTAYGGEDWELTHRLVTAGAVLAHRPRAVAWHDGPDWAGRATTEAARAKKNFETLSLARLLPDPEQRGPGVWQYPEIVVRLAGTDPAATVAGAWSVLRSGLDVQVWTDLEGLAGLDHRVTAGVVPPAVLARCRVQIDLDGPLEWAPGALADLVERVRPGGVGRVTALIQGVSVRVAASRAVHRAARWGAHIPGDPLAELFGSHTLTGEAIGAQPIGAVDLATVFRLTC